MEENKNTGQLVLTFNKKLITPAKISPELLDWELLEQTTLEIEEYQNIILDEDSNIENITSLRKDISNSKTQIDTFRKEIKKYLEAESYELNKNLITYIERWEAVRKHLHDLEKLADQKRIDLKWEKIRELKKVVAKSLVNKGLEQFIVDYDKWETKGCKMNTIESDIQEQINSLNSKYNTIDLVLKGVNEKIQNKIKIEDIIHMFGEKQEHILEYITEKEKDIIETEDKMRKNFEKDKEIAVKEAEEKAVKDTEERLKAQPNNGSHHFTVTSAPKPPVNNKKKNSYIIIQVNGLEKEIAKGLLKYCQDNEINFEFEER